MAGFLKKEEKKQNKKKKDFPLCHNIKPLSWINHWMTGRYKRTSTRSTRWSLFCFRMNVLWSVCSTGSIKDVTLQGQGGDKVPAQDRPGRQHTDLPTGEFHSAPKALDYPITSRPPTSTSPHIRFILLSTNKARLLFWSKGSFHWEECAVHNSSYKLPKFGSCVCLVVCVSGVYLLCKLLSHGEDIPGNTRCG